MNQPQKRRLGRGLAALIGDDAEGGPFEEARGFRQIPIELVFANPANPRRAFGEAEIEELAGSIRQKGLLQPLIVRPREDGQGFEIVAGERRWRAAQRAQLHEVPALVRELSDAEALEAALVENIQRADLNPLEEANAYRQLVERFGHTQQQLADALGKSRSHVANTLRLLALPEAVRRHLESGALSAGHARALVVTDAPAALAERIVAQGLSVREAERLARAAQRKRGAPVPPPAPGQKGVDLTALERQLSEATGLRVEIEHRPAGGRITVHYRSLEQLDEVCRRLGRRA
jgi:ParB family chromosome partitioning protein